MNKDGQFLGMVENRKFQLLLPETLAGTSFRLTSVRVQEAVSPESREINLAEYEGEAILIQGRESGEWIYSAELIDEAGPILTLLVQKLLTDKNQTLY